MLGSTGLPNLKVTSLDYNELLTKLNLVGSSPDYFRNDYYNNFRDIMQNYYGSIRSIPSLAANSADALLKANQAYTDSVAIKKSLLGIDFSKLSGLTQQYSDITGIIGTLKPRLPGIVNLTAGNRVEGLIRLSDNLGFVTDLSIFSNLKSLGSAGLFGNLISLSSMKQTLSDLIFTIKDLPANIKTKIMAIYKAMLASISKYMETLRSKFDGAMQRVNRISFLLTQKPYLATWTEFDADSYLEGMKDKMIHAIPGISQVAGFYDWMARGWSTMQSFTMWGASSNPIPGGPRTNTFGGPGLVGLVESAGTMAGAYLKAKNLNGVINAGISTGAILSQGLSQFAKDFFKEFGGFKEDFEGIRDTFTNLRNIIPS
jgi:hypothetical protein